MANTGYARTSFFPQRYRGHLAERHATGSDWEVMEVWEATPPTTEPWHVAAHCTVDTDAGVAGQLRIRSSTGAVSPPVTVAGFARNVRLGYIAIPNQNQLLYIEGRRLGGAGGGARLITSAMTGLSAPPANLIAGVISSWSAQEGRVLAPGGAVFSRAGINAPVAVSWPPEESQGIDKVWAFEAFPGGYPWVFDTNHAAISTPPPGGVISRWKVYDPASVTGATFDLPDRYTGFNGTLTTHAAARGVTAPPDNWRFRVLRIMAWHGDIGGGTPTAAQLIPHYRTRVQEALDVGAIVTCPYFQMGIRNVRDTPLPADLVANPTMPISAAWPSWVRDMIASLDDQLTYFATDGLGGPSPVDQGAFWFELPNEPWAISRNSAYDDFIVTLARRIRLAGAQNIIVVPLCNYGQDLAGLARGRYDSLAERLEVAGVGENLVWSWHAYGSNHAGPGGTNLGTYTYAAMDADLAAVLNTGTPSGRRFALITHEMGWPIPPGTAPSGTNSEEEAIKCLLLNTYGQPLATKYPLIPTGWSNDGTTETFFKLCYGAIPGSLTETNGDAMPWWKMAYANATVRGQWLTPYGQGLWDVSHAIESTAWAKAPALTPPTSMAPRGITTYEQSFQTPAVTLALPAGWRVGDYGLISLTTHEVNGVPTVDDSVLTSNGWSPLLNHQQNEGGGNTVPRRFRLWGKRLTTADAEAPPTIQVTDPTPPFYSLSATCTVWPLVDPTVAVDALIVTAGAPDDPNATTNPAQATVTANDAAILYSFQTASGITAVTPPAGWTLLGGVLGDNRNTHVAYRLDVGPAGTIVAPGPWVKSGASAFSESLQVLVLLRKGPVTSTGGGGGGGTPATQSDVRSTFVSDTESTTFTILPTWFNPPAQPTDKVVLIGGAPGPSDITTFSFNFPGSPIAAASGGSFHPRTIATVADYSASGWTVSASSNFRVAAICLKDTAGVAAGNVLQVFSPGDPTGVAHADGAVGLAVNILNFTSAAVTAPSATPGAHQTIIQTPLVPRQIHVAKLLRPTAGTYDPGPATTGPGSEESSSFAIIAQPTPVAAAVPAPVIPAFNPTGAITLPLTGDIAALVAAQPAGTRFQLLSGSYTNWSDVRVKTGNHFRAPASGQAILEGAGKTWAMRAIDATGSSDGVIISGPNSNSILIRNYGNGTARAEFGAVQAQPTNTGPGSGEFTYGTATGWVINGVTFDRNSAQGLRMSDYCTVYRCDFWGHTVSGLGADRNVGGLIHSCTFEANGLNPASGAYANGANVKITAHNGSDFRTAVLASNVVRPKAKLVVANCIFRGPRSTSAFPGTANIGLWFDLDCQQVEVHDTLFEAHPWIGLMFEGANNCYARGITIDNSDGYGQPNGENFIAGALTIAESTNITVENYTITNSVRAVLVRQSNRSGDWYNANNASFVNYGWPAELGGTRPWLEDNGPLPIPGLNDRANIWTGNITLRNGTLTGCEKVILSEGPNAGGMNTIGSIPLGTIHFTGHIYAGSPVLTAGGFHDRSNTGLSLAAWRALPFDRDQ